MIVNITVSLIETVYMLHFYLAGNTLSYNQLKSCETKVEMEKEKGQGLDVAIREKTQLMIVKGPQN